MWTIIIVFVVVAIVFLIIAACTREPAVAMLAMLSVSIGGLIGVCTARISTSNIPEGYQKIETYSYVTETGAVETLEGPYFKKGETYYRQELGEAAWIPFAQCDYVAVDLPGNAINSESGSSTDNENKLFCTSCGNELNAKDKFCAGCGTKIAKE